MRAVFGEMPWMSKVVAGGLTSCVGLANGGGRSSLGRPVAYFGTCPNSTWLCCGSLPAPRRTQSRRTQERKVVNTILFIIIMERRRCPCRAIVYKYHPMSPFSFTLRLLHAQHKASIPRSVTHSQAGALDGGEPRTLLSSQV